MIPGSANPLLLASAAQAGGYAIDRSLRFNSADSAYLSRTPASAGNRKTWTWAGWVKRSKLGIAQSLFSGDPTQNYCILHFAADDTLGLDSWGQGYLYTSAKFRDTSAWLHVVAAVDTTNAVAADRIILYVNGVRESGTSSSPTQNLDLFLNQSGKPHYIGRYGYSTFEHYLDGYLADVCFIDGQALTPSNFGYTDSNGIWQPKAYTGSYGTNGFHLDFADNSTAAALGTDTSGNGNDWTVNNIVAGPTTTSNSWSGYFADAAADYITAPSNAAFGMGTGDWTVEGWFYTSKTLGSFNVAWYIGTINAADGMSGSVANNSVGFRSNGQIDIASAVSINSQWTHIAWVKVGGSNTVTIYVNGTSVVSGSYANSIAAGSFKIGYDSATFRFGGYISNLRVLKGTAQYTSNFTPPTAPLTAITNTSLLTLQDSTFIDNSANNFTLTAYNGARVDFRSPFEERVDTDSFVDVPTNGTETDTGVGGEVRGNYCTLNPLGTAGATPTNGNLSVSSSSTIGNRISTFFLTSGKWYWEGMGDGYVGTIIGRAGQNFTSSVSISGSNAIGWWYLGPVYWDGGNNSGSTGYTSADVIGVALDMDAGNVKFYKNGSLIYTITFGSGTVPDLSSGVFPGYNVGASTRSVDLNFGQRPFAYTAPSGFKALCTANLPAPVVTKPSEYMDVKLYTGNGSTQTISGLEFSPDFVWTKARNINYSHQLIDVIRGGTKVLFSDRTDAEGTYQSITSFNSDGYTVSTELGVNGSGTPFVAWAWDAGSSTVTNNDGTITSQVRANPSAGFSIVTYTGTGANATVGHGLGVALSLIIIKRRDSTGNWFVQHRAAGVGYLLLNSAAAYTSSDPTAFNNTFPTSSVFSIGSGIVGNQVAYCFAPVAGYSSFGSYTGNGSADGPFVYTGFRPRWVMTKRTNDIGYWLIKDAMRPSHNVTSGNLYPNDSLAEDSVSTADMDILSNGFKQRGVYNNVNGATYIYAAFAESPFQYARAR